MSDVRAGDKEGLKDFPLLAPLVVDEVPRHSRLTHWGLLLRWARFRAAMPLSNLYQRRAPDGHVHADLIRSVSPSTILYPTWARRR